MLAEKLAKRGIKGKVEVPDQATANLYSLALDYENGVDVSTGVNYVMHATASGSALEHRSSSTSFMQPKNDWWNGPSTGNVLPAWEKSGASGAGVNVAIIDTGFTPRDWDMTAYDPITYGGWRFVYEYDFGQRDYDVSADSTGDVNANGVSWHGHGAAAVALAAQNNHYGTSGIAPDATPFLFRIGRGVGNLLSYYDAGWAVDTAVAWGADVINMSFSTLTPGGAGVPNTYLGAALQRSDNARVINVAAMGNDNRYTDNNRYPWFLYPVPAVWPTVIGVGATTWNNTRASYSNFGPAVDIWAPAEVLNVGPSPLGWASCYSTATRCSDRAGAVETYNGTSAAAPFISGTMAMMKQRFPNMSRKNALDILNQTVKRNTTDGNVNGAGLIDVGEAVWWAYGYGYLCTYNKNC
ncbi:S8 family peptidase [Deinococcus peraridilitoris]|uniref:S8 family peptidase n=1 Tax=Deinococcus peraridilitoris TaxID=432329 RepID=UPI001C2695BD|nr:S8 family serine peptidase [Deinococcus peraridilitoris]